MLIDDILKNEETIQKIMARHQQARSFCDPWHRQIKHWRSLYGFEHYPDEPKVDETLYADPTYTNVVDLAVGVLLANGIEFRALGWAPSISEERQTSQVEKYLAGTLEVNSDRNELHIPYHVILNFVRDGAGVLYTVWDPALAIEHEIQIAEPDEESETGVVFRTGYDETPILTKPIDPLEISMLPGGRSRWLMVFRTLEMSVYDVEALYGIQVNRWSGLSPEMKMQQKGQFIDYWRVVEGEEPMVDAWGQVKINEVLGRPETKTVRRVINAVIFEGQFVEPFRPRVMPGYESLPYLIDFFKPVSPMNPRDWGHSIIRPLETSVKLLEQAINRRAYQLDVFSALPLVIKAEPGRTVDIDPGIGNKVTIQPEEDIAFPVWPGNPPDLMLHIDFLRSRVQQSGFADVLFGMGASQAAGYALSQLGDQNRIRLEQPTQHLERLWARWGKHVLSLTRNFATDKFVRVYGRMRGKDFAQQVIGAEIADFLVRARIRPKFPNDEVRKHAMAAQASAWLSGRTIMERYLDVEQPDEERERRLIDEALNHPLMKLYGMASVFQKRVDETKGKDKLAVMMLQAIQGEVSRSMNAGPGAPAQPQAPYAPPLGLAGPTGQPPPQAAGAPPPGMSAEDSMERMVMASAGGDGVVA